MSVSLFYYFIILQRYCTKDVFKRSNFSLAIHRQASENSFFVFVW